MVAPGSVPAEHRARRGPQLHDRLGRRDRDVLAPAHQHGQHAAAADIVHLRRPDRAPVAHAGGTPGHLVRAAVRLRPGHPGGDPARRRDARARPVVSRRPGGVARTFHHRLPVRVACRPARVQRGGRLMIRYLRMFRAFAASEFQFEMEYRGNFYLSIFEMFLVIGTSIGAVLIMFAHTTTMNGWTLPQMIVLLGIYYLIQGGVNLVFLPSFERLMEHVRVGTLNYHLLKPVNVQFLVSTRHLRVVRAADLVLGLVVVIVGLLQLGANVGVAEAVLFALSLLFGVMLGYALLLGLVTLSFWFVRVENLLAIFWAFTEAGRFPVDVYPLWLRISLSTIVPIGIAVTAPANAIAGRMDGLGVALLGAGTVLAVGIASALWRRGLRSYTGASA